MVPLKIIIKYLAMVCFIIAFLLLIWPDLFAKTNLFSRKWFSTARLEQELNRTRDIDTQLLALRKVIGVIAIVLALIFVLILLK